MFKLGDYSHEDGLYTVLNLNIKNKGKYGHKWHIQYDCEHGGTDFIIYTDEALTITRMDAMPAVRKVIDKEYLQRKLKQYRLDLLFAGVL
jgi:hypothetical protein